MGKKRITESQKRPDNIISPSLQCKRNAKYADNAFGLTRLFILRNLVCPHLKAAFSNAPPWPCGGRSALGLQEGPASSALADSRISHGDVTSGEHVQNQVQLGLW